jgi:class 3 adenylate cyclase
MAILTELETEVAEIFRNAWTTRDGTQVPEAEDLKLGNDAVNLDGTVLYADLADSTELVNDRTPEFAAEVYKTYLHCASRIIRDEGGVITAFDGDRIMGVFIGDSKNTSAARCALKINHAVVKIINPGIQKQYSTAPYTVKHAVGVDTSKLFIARTGVRGANDLVWVGRAANYAAKMCSLRDGNYASWITKAVYDVLAANVKTSNGTPMWEERNWTARNMTVYRSNWRWSP